MYMEKVLQELFWTPIPFRRYQNTSGCGTGFKIQWYLCELRLAKN